jgi:hypothetical protein
MEMKGPQKSPVIASKKKELYEKSEQYKSAVTTDIKRLKFDIERIGKNILIIGGSLYVAYKLSKLFSGSSSADKKEEKINKVVQSRETSAMALKIKEQIALFLLALAFRKLKEFVQDNGQKKDEKEDSRDTE